MTHVRECVSTGITQFALSASSRSFRILHRICIGYAITIKKKKSWLCSIMTFEFRTWRYVLHENLFTGQVASKLLRGGGQFDTLTKTKNVNKTNWNSVKWIKLDSYLEASELLLVNEGQCLVPEVSLPTLYLVGATYKSSGKCRYSPLKTLGEGM